MGKARRKKINFIASLLYHNKNYSSKTTSDIALRAVAKLFGPEVASGSSSVSKNKERITFEILNL